MTARQKKPQAATVFPVDPKAWPPGLYAAVLTLSAANDLLVFRVGPSQSPAEFAKANPSLILNPDSSRVLVLFNGLVMPRRQLDWRSWLIEQVGHARFAPIPDREPADWTSWLQSNLHGWLNEGEQNSGHAIEVGHFVKLGEPTRLGDPCFLTLRSGGVLDPVIDELDLVKRRYRKTIGGKVGERRAKVLEAAAPLLKMEAGRASATAALRDAVERALADQKFAEISQRSLPRILLLAESGTGKSLIASYLAWRTSAGANERRSRPLKRIPLPEYLGDEERLEFELFGYVAGAYSNARPAGEPGALLQNLGGVIFLDEIGDANPALQAKLLAFLDDYRVTPRGWPGEGLFCPVMIVAATNKPVDKWAEEDAAGEGRSRFRHDLFQRFDRVLRLPSLNDRKEELPWIVDAMLQTKEVNPGRQIVSFASAVIEELRDADFRGGNFRFLERILVDGCRRASAAGRQILRAGDVLMKRTPTLAASSRILANGRGTNG